MLNNAPYYHGTIRKAIVAFGHLFSSIYIDRRIGDAVTGDFEKRVQVPIAYGPKEKFMVRLEQDESLEQYVAINLPRMGFEVVGFTYDATRKFNKNIQIVCNDGENGSRATYTPVPYNLTMNLYIVTATQGDGLQIVEQILPTFTPDYSMRIMALTPMEIVSNVPIHLDSTAPEDSGEGLFEDTRLVTWQLTFTMKLDLYGPVQVAKPIYHVFANISTSPTMLPVAAAFTAHGVPETYEIIDEGWLEGF